MTYRREAPEGAWVSRDSSTVRFSFQRVERPMIVTKRSGLTRAQALSAIESARQRSGDRSS